MFKSFQTNLKSIVPEDGSTREASIKDDPYKHIKFKRTPRRAERKLRIPPTSQDDLKACNSRYKQRNRWPYYQVARIVDQRTGIRWDRWYKVRWLKYGPKHDSWVKSEDLNCPDKLEEFLKEKQIERIDQ